VETGSSASITDPGVWARAPPRAFRCLHAWSRGALHQDKPFARWMEGPRGGSHRADALVIRMRVRETDEEACGARVVVVGRQGGAGGNRPASPRLHALAQLSPAFFANAQSPLTRFLACLLPCALAPSTAASVYDDGNRTVVNELRHSALKPCMGSILDHPHNFSSSLHHSLQAILPP